MDINSVATGTPSYYTRGATLSNNTLSRQDNDADQTSFSASYRVNLSSEGIDRSKAQFESRQASDLRAFDRNQTRKEQVKDRELNTEKNQFEREQAAEKRRFEAEQRLEKIKFARNKSL